MIQAAIGLRVHSGWAAMVALKLDKGVPSVIARQRVHLVDTFTYEFRQPYHTALKLPLDEARDFIQRVRKDGKRLAYRAILGLQKDLQKQGITLKTCGLLLASGKTLPELSKILSSHPMIHTADGELFREALLHAVSRCGIRKFKIKEKELLEHSSKVLRRKSADLLGQVTELGQVIGSPWTQDEKFTTIAAWVALMRPRK